MKRDLSPEDFAGLELEAERRNRFALAQFAELDEHPCTTGEDIALTLGTFLLGISPVLVVIFFAVTK
jgi:hypothetical protein